MGFSRAAVVDAALDVLDEQGLEKVTMRAVEDRLGVQHNTVRWHAENKQRLLVLMSDAVLAGLDVAALPIQWEDRFRALARWYRKALLAHRDGARLVSGIATTETNTYRLADTVIQTLLDAGFPPRTASWATWTVSYLILGITQEQQAQSADASVPATATTTAPDPVLDFDGEEFPAFRKASGHVTSGTFDERFEFALDMQVTALQVELARTGSWRS